MPTTQAKYYRDTRGNQPVRDYIRSLDSTRQAAIEFKIVLLNNKPEGAPPPDFPATSQVRGHLRELRCHYGRELYRILYRRSGNFLVLLHALRKDSAALHDADIDIAERRFEDFKHRMDAEPRVPPRPVGGDAP